MQPQDSEVRHRGVVKHLLTLQTVHLACTHRFWLEGLADLMQPRVAEVRHSAAVKGRRVCSWAMSTARPLPSSPSWAPLSSTASLYIFQPAC